MLAKLDNQSDVFSVNELNQGILLLNSVEFRIEIRIGICMLQILKI